MATKLFKYVPKNDHVYLVCVNSEKESPHLGLLMQDDAGLFMWWPINSGGAWAAYALKEIAEKLEELNKDREAEMAIELAKFNSGTM